MIHYETDQVTIWHGDCIDVMRELPDASVDAVVTDPPYGLGFMGQKWDTYSNETGRRPSERAKFDHVGGNHNPSNSADQARTRRVEARKFGEWCEEWATEAHRVLKPGGHLLAFGGTRTHHRLASGIEDAGFEIRDSIAWLYGSGFPKSLDVSKAIDKLNGRQFEDRYALGRHIRERREAAGLTAAQVNAWFGYRDGCQHWERQDPSGARVPTVADYTILRDRLGLDDDWADLVARIEAERDIVGTGKSGAASVAYRRAESSEYDVTAPATLDAARWQGWGTALKPAFEPIVVARKPLTGTVAANVLQHGTGALNIDASRIGMAESEDRDKLAARSGGTGEKFGRGIYQDGMSNDGDGWKIAPAGRWPANVILDASQAAALDAQSGVSSSPFGVVKQGGRHGFGPGGTQGAQRDGEGVGYGDTGGASRYFKTVNPDVPFRYTAKAGGNERPKVEREGGGNGRVTGLGGKIRQCNVCGSRSIESGAVAPSCGHDDFHWAEPTTSTGDVVSHPTVKPLDLMRWLVRLVTPKGGTVLEPFAGSGTTVEAAVLEGFRCIAIEREADYLPLIMQRIGKPHAVGLDFGDWEEDAS